MKKQIHLGFSSTAAELNEFHTALYTSQGARDSSFLNKSDKGLKLVHSLKKQFLQAGFR